MIISLKSVKLCFTNEPTTTVLYMNSIHSLLQSHNQTHCFGLKIATTAQPQAPQCGGSRGGGYFLCSPEDLRNKTLITTT
jgi:hypothetical protein